jgi:serine/threonine protein kinase
MTFAIKSIPRSLISKTTSKSNNQDLGFEKDSGSDSDELVMQELLQSEIQIVLEMDHPNIVKFYQCCYDNQYINIVMELVDGLPLSDYLLMQKNIRIPEENCQLIMYNIMCAIKYFHHRGVVHRDMKLDNVMILGHKSNDIRDLQVKLIDFGMSKLTQNKEKTKLTTYCGTIDFISPEVL